MLKKITACILAGVLALSFSSVSFAETLDIRCELSSESVQTGDTFYADFKIDNNTTGYKAMQCYLDFDPNVLEAVECDVEDIPDDLIIYTNYRGVNYSIFSYTNVNGRLNFVPKKGDKDYLGRADGATKAGKLGRLKLASLLNAVVDGVSQNYTSNGTLLRVKFKAIAPGTSEIAMNDVVGLYAAADGSEYELDFNVGSGSVDVYGDPVNEEPSSEATTADKQPETTTAAAGSINSSSSGGSSGGGTSSKTTTTQATTSAEENTEATTSAPVIGGDDGSTSIMVTGFTDVPQSFWAYSYINDLASAGIVNGYPDNTFRPQNNVTRADFLIMLLRALGISETDISEDGFTDVEPTAYYAAACSTAKTLGIASGNPDGSFNPRGYITRQDMMVLAEKAVKLAAGKSLSGDLSALDKFTDKADISPYAQQSLAAMVSAGVVNGIGTEIAPRAYTTRAQAATIIAKALEAVK